jgi:predicted nucleotidyltransferase
MDQIIADHRLELAALCEKYEVRQLELFGSAAGGEFDLVDIAAARNPYFVAEALQHRVLLYAA